MIIDKQVDTQRKLEYANSDVIKYVTMFDQIAYLFNQIAKNSVSNIITKSSTV